MYRSFSAVAAAAVAAFAFAAPASAAPPSVDVLLPDIAVAAGTSTEVSPILFAKQETTLHNAVMTYELSGDLGGAELKADEFGDCQADGPAKLTCTVPYEISTGPYGVQGYFDAELSAPKTALGRTGKITSVFTADGVAKVTSTAEVTVAEGVDLVAGKRSTVSVKVGAGFNAPLEVRNNSDKVVRGAGIIFNTDYAFSSAKQFSNCWYSGGQVNACTFAQDLQPGVTYRTVLPYQLRADTAAPGGAYGEFQWLTGDDFQARLKYLDQAGYEGPGAAGQGGKLALTAKSALRASEKQTDTNEDNNWTSVEVKTLGKQGTDFAAVGATVKGAQGDTVTLPVGARNAGPATVDASRAGSAAATVIVTIPAKTKVVTVPEGCNKAEDDSVKTNPKALQYVCFSSPLFPARTTKLWKFGVELTGDITDGKGLVEVNPPCQCERFSRDINKKNDSAAIWINQVAGAGSGGQGGGGSLAITGTRTAFVGGAGAVLVAAGVLGFFVARRRRTRFEA